MTSELRPAVAVWQEAYWTWANDPSFGSTARSVSIIEADREAVRAEVVRDIVAWLRSATNGDDTIKYARLFADEIEDKFGKSNVAD